MYWLIVGGFFWLFAKLFGFDRAVSIMMWIALLIPALFFGAFFYFFVLPSQTWQGL